MAQRTAPTDALERLAWMLTFHEGDTVSVNHLAETCGMSWATTRKYSQLLEVLSNIAPSVTVTDDGISVSAIATPLRAIEEQSDLAVLLYLLTVADAKGDLLIPIELSTHEPVLSRYGDTLDSLADNGLVSLTDETVSLTPSGVSMSAPIRAKLRAGVMSPVEIPPNPRIVKEEDHASPTDDMYTDDSYLVENDWKPSSAVVAPAGD